MGTRQENTNFRDLSASKFHRKLGRKIFMTDIDGLEYKYAPSGIEFVAVIDYKAVLNDKYNLQPIYLNRSSIQANRHLANKLEIPFFIVVTYLTDNYEVPMYYVYPANENANKYKPTWMSVHQFSEFQHELRNISPNQMEIGCLSKEMAEYNLPKIL